MSNINDILITLGRLARGRDYISKINLDHDSSKKLADYICQKHQEIKRLNDILKTKDESIKAFVEDLYETYEELEKANNKIKMALDYIQNAKEKDINYVATLLLGYPIEISEMREQFLESIGSE